MWQEPQLPWPQKNWPPNAASPETIVYDAGAISGDVVELGDTLVLGTSALVHESSNLSIPTKGL